MTLELYNERGSEKRPGGLGLPLVYALNRKGILIYVLRNLKGIDQRYVSVNTGKPEFLLEDGNRET